MGQMKRTKFVNREESVHRMKSNVRVAINAYQKYAFVTNLSTAKIRGEFFYVHKAYSTQVTLELLTYKYDFNSSNLLPFGIHSDFHYSDEPGKCTCKTYLA